MRFMMLVKAHPRSEAGAPPHEALMVGMARYRDALAQAGVLLDANGLRGSHDGWRIHYRGGERRVVDGSFVETGTPVAGYTLIEVSSAEAALEWSRRFPAPFGEGVDAEIEVRPVLELDDFAPGPAAAPLRSLQA